MKQTMFLVAVSMSLFACGSSATDQTQQSEDEVISSVCGNAGEPCCFYGYFECNAGLECNANGVCRRPCGSLNEPCCSYGCDQGLQCNGGLCRIDGSGSGGGGGPGQCTPCATRECGWDTSCGELNKQYCGDCPMGQACGGGFCYQKTDAGLPSNTTCTLQCTGGMVCREDAFGQYCGFGN